MSFVSYSFIFFKKCTSFTNYMHIIFNAFLQRFPSRLSKISPKPEHLLLDNQSKVLFSDVIGIFLQPLRENFFFISLFNSILQCHIVFMVLDHTKLAMKSTLVSWLWENIFIRCPINQTNQLDIYVMNFPLLNFL